MLLKVGIDILIRAGNRAIVEYFGEGATNMSCTGKGTISNMVPKLVLQHLLLWVRMIRCAGIYLATGRQDVVDGR
jgi:aconitate hydratase